MKKYIVLSVNENQDYLFYLPLTMWAWRKFGWEPIVFYHRNSKPDKDSDLAGIEELTLSTPGNDSFHPYFLSSIEGYRSDTITQVSRLYGACLTRFAIEDILMLGDIDLLPLRDAWHPEEKDITVYNHDLTDYTEYPMCFVAMTVGKWRAVMDIQEGDYNAFIKRDLDNHPNARSTDFYKYWGVDQQILTDRISKERRFEKTFIYNGKLPNGYAAHRIDRGSWNVNVDNPKDCHMHRDLFKAFYPEPNLQHVDKWNQTLDMLEKCFPDEDFTWFIEYTKAYAKLAHGK
jgi:hypothetical protein